MKISKQQPFFKRPIFWIIVVGILVLCGAGAYTYYASPRSHPSKTDTSNSKIDYNPPTEDQKKAGDQIKKNNIDNQNTNQSNSGNAAANLSISRAGQSSAGQPVSVRIMVSGVTSGQCVLTFTKSEQTTVTKTVDVTYNATYYACNEDVPASDFPVSGDWSLSAYVNYNNSRVSSAVNWAGNPISVQR